MGITTLAYYPLAMGLLSGKYSSINSITNKLVDKTSTKTKFEVNDLNKYQKIDKLLLVMEEIAQKRNKTIPQIALNWIICKGAIPIPGARNKGQLVDNAGARGWRLSSDEVKLLEMIADETGLTFEGAGFKRSSEKFVGYGVEKWQLN